MGYGDRFHVHPLKIISPYKLLDYICSRCELPIPTDISRYGCTRCDYYIHDICSRLPKMMLHPLHNVHHLTLLEPSPSPSVPYFSQNHTSNITIISDVNISTALCNKCHTPCLGFTYHCQTCPFFLHLKCALIIDHAKHKHPLSLDNQVLCNEPSFHCEPFVCSVCGYPAGPLAFSCRECNFFIHPECTLLPPTYTHRHVHELTFNHNIPEECEQVYCDLCEDKNGEMDRTLSYYYCKKCDYIAHVCCVLELREDAVLFENFSHKHPLKIARIRMNNSSFGELPKKNSPSGICNTCGFEVGDYGYYYRCNNCEHVAHKWCDQFPSSINHPHHREHTLTLDNNSSLFRCKDCVFNLHISELVFSHPLVDGNLKFGISESMFRCDACGELGIGSRMFCKVLCFDLHLECFALPGELPLDSHSSQHPLHLWSHVPPSKSYLLCAICQKETDPELWIYCCEECPFVAHINCIASDLLTTLRSSIINHPDFVTFIQYDEKLFKTSSRPPNRPYQKNICSSLSKDQRRYFLGLCNPLFSSNLVENQWLEEDEKEGRDYRTAKACFTQLNMEITCPECKQLISTQAYTCIEGTSSSDVFSGPEFELDRESISFVDKQTTTNLDSLTLLDEQSIDDTYCPICNVLIFSPTYSCATCLVFIHKFCANLPIKYTFGEHTYELVAPPFDNGLNNCACCENSIIGYAYLCKACGIILDLHCAVGAPNINHGNDMLICFHKLTDDNICNACGNIIEDGTLMFCNTSGSMCLHIECALLPRILKHRIHQHPLGLAEDLLQYRDEYICDVCEQDLNPLLWGYRCVDSCKGSATSHVTCLISSKKKCHFVYNDECRAPSVDELCEEREIREIDKLSDW